MGTTTTPPTGVVPRGMDHSTDTAANGGPNPITGTTAGQVSTGTPPNTDTAATGGPPSAALQQHEPGTPNNAPPTGAAGVSHVQPISPGMQTAAASLQSAASLPMLSTRSPSPENYGHVSGTRRAHPACQMRGSDINERPAESQQASNSCEHRRLYAAKVLVT